MSLGNLISEYKGAFATRPFLFWWPGLFIIIFALCINLIGDGLRDAFDPRQRRIPKSKDLSKARVSSPMPTPEEESAALLDGRTKSRRKGKGADGVRFRPADEPEPDGESRRRGIGLWGR